MKKALLFPGQGSQVVGMGLEMSQAYAAAREVFEETGLKVKVGSLLAADFWGSSQLDLLFRCTVESGTYQSSDETGRHAWVLPNQLPELLPNQLALLRKARLFD